MRRDAGVLLVVLACLCTSLVTAAESLAGTKTLPSSAVRRELNGQPRWKVLPDLFISRTLTITCKGRQFNVYTAASEEELQFLYSTGSSAWCGGLLEQAFQRRPKKCTATISPFGPTLVAVVPDGAWQAESLGCTFVESKEWSWQLFVPLLVGVTLFYLAPAFARSLTFRVSAGGFVSVILFSIVLAFFLFRALGYARHGGKVMSVAAILGAMGVSVTGLASFWLRFTNVSDVLHSRWMLAYVAVSFLFGTAITYYFDNTEDRKLNNILKVFLRLCGASLVAYAMQQLWEIAVMSIVVMLLALWSLPDRASEALLQQQQIMVTPTSADELHMGDNYSPSLTTPKSSGAVSQRYQADKRLSLNSTPQLHLSPAQRSSSTSWLPSIARLLSRTTPLSAPPRSRPDVEQVRNAQLLTGNNGVPQLCAASQPVQRALSNASFQHSEGTPHSSQPHVRSPAASAPVPDSKQESPLLAQGIIKNEQTGRFIKIGGKVYNTLLDQGYELNTATGTISPPPRTHDRLAALHTGVSPSRYGAKATHTQSPRRPSPRRRTSAARPADSTATSPY